MKKQNKRKKVVKQKSTLEKLNSVNKNKKVEKRKVGRPSKYDSEMCDKVIECMRIGMSKYELCLELNVCMDTITEWQKHNKEFSAAIKKGVMFSQGWWEREARLNIGNKSFNAVLWYMNMKNRFGYKDKVDIESDKDVSITVNYKKKKER